MITDSDRSKFLVQIDGSDLLVSEWDRDFIGNFMQAGSQSTWFTPGRRQSTDRMMLKYGGELGLKVAPAATPASTAPRPAAAPGCCEFLVREAGRLEPCNLPALWRARTGMRYCQRHAEQAQEFCQKKGRPFELQKLR